MTTFSVIMPAYNAGAYLEESLTSIFGQSEQDFEILLIDDGSTDDTAERIRPFRADERFCYFAQQNQGVAAARNLGLENARGRYIAFLDADDLWHPHKLRSHLELLEANTSLGMSFNWFHLLHDDKPVGRLALPWFDPPTQHELNWTTLLERNWTGTSSTVVVRAESLKERRAFAENFRTGEDYHLWLRIAQAGWGVGFIPEPLSIYRKRSGSLTVDHLQIARDHLHVLEDIAHQGSEHAMVLKAALDQAWLDVAWASLKVSQPQPAWKALRLGYPAIPHFLRERLSRKFRQNSSVPRTV
jgi:teichuronic acid biosynthesis glycosyltransferase TuaG